MPSTNPEFPSVKQRVLEALHKKHLKPDDEAVDAIAIVGAGYVEGQSGSVGLLFPAIPQGLLAMRLVSFYRDGDKPYPPTKAVERHIFRGTVDGLLDAIPGVVAGEVTRQTLTSLALGAWDEAAEKALKVWIAGYIVSLYCAGID